MKIAFAALFDGRDVTRGSGTFYHLCQELERQGHELIYIKAPIRNSALISRIVRKMILNHGLPYPGYLDPFLAKSNGEQTSKELSRLDFDWLLTNDFGLAAFIWTDKPVLLYTDATFPKSNSDDFYYRRLPSIFKAYFRYTVKKGLNKIALAVFPSDFAHSCAQKYIGSSRVMKIPFGANIPDPGPQITWRRSMETIRKRGEIKFLFIGTNWKHKNGNIVVETVNYLNQCGIRATLAIVGIRGDSLPPMPEYVTTFSILDKRSPKDFQMLSDLYAMSDVFMLPSKYEGFGIVFAEAAAYGLPSLACRNSGVVGSVENGVSGILLNSGATPEEFALVVKRWFEYPDEYLHLVQGARKHYEQSLNWKSSVKNLVQAMQNFQN